MTTEENHTRNVV